MPPVKGVEAPGGFLTGNPCQITGLFLLRLSLPRKATRKDLKMWGQKTAQQAKAFVEAPKQAMAVAIIGLMVGLLALFVALGTNKRLWAEATN